MIGKDEDVCFHSKQRTGRLCSLLSKAKEGGNLWMRNFRYVVINLCLPGALVSEKSRS